MDRALYIAMTGASATLKSQATVSHNLANAQTVGFQATLDATQAMPVTGNGLASRVATAQRLVGVSDASGSLSTTGNGMDVALQPGHWFAVQDKAGGTAYTRAGDLKITQNGLLTTASGLQLLDAGGAPMVIPPNDGMDIGADGTISVIPQGSPASSMTQIGRLQVVRTSTLDLARGEDGLMRQAPGCARADAGRRRGALHRRAGEQQCRCHRFAGVDDRAGAPVRDAGTRLAQRRRDRAERQFPAAFELTLTLSRNGEPP